MRLDLTGGQLDCGGLTGRLVRRVNQDTSKKFNQLLLTLGDLSWVWAKGLDVNFFKLDVSTASCLQWLLEFDLKEGSTDKENDKYCSKTSGKLSLK